MICGFTIKNRVAFFPALSTIQSNTEGNFSIDDI
jgi:hypothetical protein